MTDKLMKIAKLVVAIAAALAILYKPITFLIAQEVKKYEAPTQRRLSNIEDLLIEDKAHKEFLFCLEYEYQDLDADGRRHLCSQDKEARIVRWKWEKCMNETGNATEICGREPPDPDKE